MSARPPGNIPYARRYRESGNRAGWGALNMPVTPLHRERGITLGAISDTPRTCRAIVNAALHSRGLAELADDACLVADELATNAVTAMTAQDAEAPGERPVPVVVLVLGWRPTGIRIELWDTAPGEPRMREPDWLAESGRGLRIVHDVTRGRWGCRPEAAGKCVWAEISRPLPGRARRARPSRPRTAPR